MKVGIITFHNAFNYGAVLQAYATQEIVRSFGFEAEIIDYHNMVIDNTYESRKFSFVNFFKSRYKFPLYLLEKYFFWKRRNSYYKFSNSHLHLSNMKYIQGDDIALVDYDVILIGSDQLWNKKLTNGFDDVYWGHFKTSSHSRVIAWSVSMDYFDLSPEDNKYIVNSLNRFFTISVREKSLQDYLIKILNKSCQQTLDPTLLLTKDRWELICKPVKERNYIAVYAVQDEYETIKFARQVARIINKKVIVIRAYSTYRWSSEDKESCGPIEFLSYIRNADYVVTTSFHGTVFSLLFQKQFVCPVFRENSRIESLLELVNLGERRISEVNDILKLSIIDYEKVTNKINDNKSDTLSFLSNVLN